MNSIKKATITVGTIVGGVVGGSVQLVGKMSGVKFIDSLGESIMDSTIYTSTIAGEIISGGVEVAAGKILKSDDLKTQGKENLKSGGGKVVDNFVGNFKTVAASGGEILDGAVHLNGRKVVRAGKKLVKIVVVGAVTVGAIKIAEDEESENESGLGKTESSKNNRKKNSTKNSTSAKEKIKIKSNDGLKAKIKHRIKSHKPH